MLQPLPALKNVFKVIILEGDECTVNPVLPMPIDGVNIHDIYAGTFKYNFGWSQEEKYFIHAQHLA